MASIAYQAHDFMAAADTEREGLLGPARPERVGYPADFYQYQRGLNPHRRGYKDCHVCGESGRSKLQLPLDGSPFFCRSTKACRAARKAHSRRPR